MEAKTFVYLVQVQKQEYLKKNLTLSYCERVRLPRVTMAIIRGEGKGEERVGN